LATAVLSQSEKTNSRITETSFSKPYAEIKRALATRLRQAYGAAGREWTPIKAPNRSPEILNGEISLCFFFCS
jgi:hypothetical protein